MNKLITSTSVLSLLLLSTPQAARADRANGLHYGYDLRSGTRIGVVWNVRFNANQDGRIVPLHSDGYAGLMPEDEWHFAGEVIHIEHINGFVDPASKRFHIYDAEGLFDATDQYLRMNLPSGTRSGAVAGGVLFSEAPEPTGGLLLAVGLAGVAMKRQRRV